MKTNNDVPSILNGAPIEDGVALAELERRVRDLRALKEFADTMLGHRGGIEEVLWAVAQQAIARMDLEDCVIYLLDEERGDLIQCAAFGPKNPREREILNPIRIPLGKGIVGSVAATGRIEMIADTRLDPRYIEDDQLRHAELAVPILHEDKVIGVIDSEHSVAGFFKEWHRDLFVAIAAMASGRITAALLEAQRRRLASHDGLTGLVNRSELLQRLQKLLDQAENQVAVVFIDLDHFSVFNDSMSHLTGDELLRTVAKRIIANAPSGAIVARYGGDEFVVAFDGNLADGEQIAQSISKAIARTLEAGAVSGLSVTCSAGVAAGIANDSAMELIHQADLAMYESKRNGRNRVSLHDTVLATSRRHEQRIVVELTRAIEQNDAAIDVHFQPIYSLAGQRMIGLEALARWRHPEFGTIPPTEFIAAAERTGKIHLLGENILRRALSNHRDWHDSRTDFVLNVNVSPLQLQHEDFARRLVDVLSEFGLTSTDIACEITETALLGDDQRAAQAVYALADRGIRLILDDFGTGYASLATLTQYPFAGVKIDRRFVRSLATNPKSRAIVQSVITLARDLGLSCTAEGVEQQSDLDKLREMGCPLAQGRWLCGPLPAHRLRALLTNE